MARLVKKLDKLVAGRQDEKLAAVVNFLGEGDKKAEKRIYKFGEKLDLQKIPLATTNDGEKFRVNDAAAVTVMIYRGKKVKSNYALAEGELDLRTVFKIIKSTKKMLQEPAQPTAEKRKPENKPAAESEEKTQEKAKPEAEKAGP